MNKLLYTFTLIILFFTSIIAQKTPEFISDSLDHYINRAMEQWKIPGAAVLVIKDGEIIISKGYGVKEFGTNDRVDENTLFMIGSNTKAFTGTALALLEHEGKLNLEDKVIKYLPDFKMKDSWVTKELNIIDIVSHRMGYETFQGDFMYWASDLNEDEVIEKFGQLTPKYDFRTRYGYTNAGYAVAGKIIEKISDSTWDEYLKEKILKPLGMNRTTLLSVDFFKVDNIAKPHTILDNEIMLLPFENIDNMAPCGSIGSSVKELSYWLIAQLDSGKINGDTLIPYNVIAKTRRPNTIVRKSSHPFNKTHYSLYGLGWALQDYESNEIISHTGGVNGFVTSVTLIPKEKLGIVVLTNTDQNAFFTSLKWEIIDAYLNLPYRNYDDFIFERASKQNQEKNNSISEWRDSVSMRILSDIDLNKFAGIYEHEVYGFAELILKENYLELKLQHHSKVTGKLEYIGSNRFLCTYSDLLYGIKVFPFEIENGQVKSFDLYVDDFIEFLPYTFMKQ